MFTPLALETLGGWHPVAEAELRKLGAALARQTGQEDPVATSHLLQKLSVLLVKGNCAMINNRQPGLRDDLIKKMHLSFGLLPKQVRPPHPP